MTRARNEIMTLRNEVFFQPGLEMIPLLYITYIPHLHFHLYTLFNC